MSLPKKSDGTHQKTRGFKRQLKSFKEVGYNFVLFGPNASVHVGFSQTFFELKLGLIVVCDCIVGNACSSNGNDVAAVMPKQM